MFLDVSAQDFHVLNHPTAEAPTDDLGTNHFVWLESCLDLVHERSDGFRLNRVVRVRWTDQKGFLLCRRAVPVRYAATGVPARAIARENEVHELLVRQKLKLLYGIRTNVGNFDVRHLLAL